VFIFAGKVRAGFVPHVRRELCAQLVDAVYAHSIQSRMASVAESVTQRALGVKPQLRVIEGGNSRDIRNPLDETADQEIKSLLLYQLS
jgi:hypothetical protein